MTESTQQLLARVSKILARAEKSTLGPWIHSNDIGHIWACDAPTSKPLVAVFDGFTKSKLPYDAEFIAAARSDVPALCHAVQELGNPWISVKERLPKKGLIVIVDGGIARYEGERGWITETSGAHGCRIEWTVTHWMPLPSPPQEKP